MFGACETFDAECPSPTCKGVSLATTPSTSLARVGETFTDLWTDLILSPKDTTIRPAARKSALTLNLFNIPRDGQREFPDGSQASAHTKFIGLRTLSHYQPSAFESTRWLLCFHKMLQGAHVFSHQHQYNPQGEPSWMHQQSHHQHAQQAAAAAASAAQQQHYNRIAANHNSAAPSIASGHGQDSMMETVSEENRRTLNFIADLLNEDTREAALLELSKKREQVPELALILWHSFGMFIS